MHSPSRDPRLDISLKRKRKDSYTEDGTIPAATGISGQAEQTEASGTSTSSRGKTDLVHGSKPLLRDIGSHWFNDPSRASKAAEFLDLYLRLWECYVAKSAANFRLEEDRNILQSDIQSLTRGNDQLRLTCTNKELLLWDRRQTFHSLYRNLIAIVRSIDSVIVQMPSSTDTHFHWAT